MTISVAIRDGIVEVVYTNAHSSMNNNVKISAELSTELEDLEELDSKIIIPDNFGSDEAMTKEQVISILGNNYIEVYKDALGYSALKWYDKNENVLEVGFTKDEKAWYKTKVTASEYSFEY